MVACITLSVGCGGMPPPMDYREATLFSGITDVDICVGIAVSCTDACGCSMLQ